MADAEDVVQKAWPRWGGWLERAACDDDGGEAERQAELSQELSF